MAQVVVGLERLIVAQWQRDQLASFFPHRVELRRGLSVSLGRFPGYLFVSLDLDEYGWQAAARARGVLRLLPGGVEEPTPLPRGFIEELQALYAGGAPPDDLVDQTVLAWADGDWGRVEEGPFLGHVGKFQRKARGAVELLVTLLGREIALKVPAHQVSKVAPSGEMGLTTTTKSARYAPQFRRRDRPHLMVASSPEACQALA